MKLSKKLIIIIVAVLVLLIGGGVVYAINTPTARAERQLNLGNKYLEEGKYQEAILAFQQVIQIEPKNIPARLGLGNAYIATNEYDKAETVLKEVIDIDPNNIPAREKLFQVYVKEGNLEAANGILKEITILDPQKDMGQYSTDLDLAKAISTSKVSYELGIKQMNDKQYLVAIDSFQKVIKEDAERYDDAQTKTSECKKSFVEETLQKAKDAAANNDYQTALNLLEQVLKIESDNPDALQLKSEYSKLLQDAIKNFSVEIRNTNKPPMDTALGAVPNNELWIKYSNGNEELLVASRESPDLKKRIAGISNPQVSIDRTKVYFKTIAAVTSDQVFVVNVKTKEVKWVCYGNCLKVVTKGQYKGNIIVSKHEYLDGGGSINPYYIVDDSGNKIVMIDPEQLNQYCDN